MIGLRDISHVCMIAGILTLAAAAVFYIRLDIYNAWHILTGRPFKGRKYLKKRQHNTNATALLTEHISVQQPACDNECTDRLDPEDMPDYQYPICDKQDSVFEIVYEVTYIHDGM